MSAEDLPVLGKGLGTNLALLRESRGLKQAELARKAHMTPGSLSLYEADKKVPKLATLFRLLDALDYGLAALDRANEFRLSLQLASRRRAARLPGVADPLRAEVRTLANEAGAAVGRLTDAVALLARTEPTSERVCALAAAEGYPLPEDRAKAVKLWEKIRKYSREVRRAFVAEYTEYHLWSFSELLAHESEDAAPHDVKEALDLAQLALEVADLMPGDKARRSRSRGYARGHLANAQRVHGELNVAEQSFALSAEEWKAGEGCPGDLLNEARLLDLRSSLLTAQRDLPEAFRLIGQALKSGGPEMRGRLLIKKSRVLEEQDDLDAAIAALEEAEPHIDANKEPRLWLCVRHNRLWCQTTAGRHKEAEELLPEVKPLAAKLGKELDRVRLKWAEARIAVGLGRIQQGIDLYTQVRAEFVSREIWFDAALVTLELAVVFLQEGRSDMVKTLAAHLAPIFNHNGVHREALAALALFRKAADQEKVTLELAQSLVSYLRKAQHDPDVKFEKL
jgi:transcriptional regulator with XRE-family HTH domain